MCKLPSKNMLFLGTNQTKREEPMNGESVWRRRGTFIHTTSHWSNGKLDVENGRSYLTFVLAPPNFTTVKNKLSHTFWVIQVRTSYLSNKLKLNE